jgi:ferredoxin
MPGIEIQVNDNCNGCGLCTENICFIGGISIKNGKANISNNCVVCGRCAEKCPNDAIDLIIKNEDFIKDTIDRVIEATR